MNDKLTTNDILMAVKIATSESADTLELTEKTKLIVDHYFGNEEPRNKKIVEAILTNIFLATMSYHIKEINDPRFIKMIKHLECTFEFIHGYIEAALEELYNE